MFAILGDGPPVTVTLKLTREEREVALEMPFVSEARYVGRYGWVTVRIEDADCLEAALEWMRESYWLKAPEDVREASGPNTAWHPRGCNIVPGTALDAHRALDAVRADVDQVAAQDAVVGLAAGVDAERLADACARRPTRGCGRGRRAAAGTAR